MRRIMVLTLLALALPTAALASTITLPVANPSFEILPSNFPSFDCPGAGCKGSVGVIPSWTIIGGEPVGVFQPGTQDHNFMHFDRLAPRNGVSTSPHGDNITSAFSTGVGIIEQSVGSVVAGDSYDLKLAIGSQRGLSFGGSAVLCISSGALCTGAMHTFKATGTQPAVGHWSVFNAMVPGTATAALGAQHITIQLITSAGNRGNFDSVKLTQSSPSAVPEPSTLMMLGAGLLPVFGMVRRTYLSRS